MGFTAHQHKNAHIKKLRNVALINFLSQQRIFPCITFENVFDELEI